MASLIESLPGYCVGQTAYDEYMGERFNTKGIFFCFAFMFLLSVYNICSTFNVYWLRTLDPYYDSNGHRRKLPPNATDKQKKLWKKIQNMAYKHDKCMFGMKCCDLGVGLAPIACK